MTEQELVIKLEKFGYTHLWLDYNVLTEEILLEQQQLFDLGEDQNTEHYRYGTCVNYLSGKQLLSDSELENFFELLQNDPNTYMSGSAAIEIFKRIELTDKQFDWLAEKVTVFGDWTGKIVFRQTLLRKLYQEDHTEELISHSILTGDSFVQSYLLDHCKLNQSQLEELNIHGKNKKIRTIAEKRLNDPGLSGR